MRLLACPHKGFAAGWEPAQLLAQSPLGSGESLEERTTSVSPQHTRVGKTKGKLARIAPSPLSAPYEPVLVKVGDSEVRRAELSCEGWAEAGIHFA